jgi:hypothetical protein
MNAKSSLSKQQVDDLKPSKLEIKQAYEELAAYLLRQYRKKQST